MGKALLAIRDAKLYRKRHKTFEAYCRERWAMYRIHAHRTIEAAEVAENLLPMGNNPSNERVARPLTRLPKDEQKGAWSEASGLASPSAWDGLTRDLPRRPSEHVA